jgi:hypothetical protein
MCIIVDYTHGGDGREVEEDCNCQVLYLVSHTNQEDSSVCNYIMKEVAGTENKPRCRH